MSTQRDPAWFAAVMGTGATATVAAANPGRFEVLQTPSRILALALMTVAVILFAALVVDLALFHRPTLARMRSPITGPAHATIPGAILVLAAGLEALFPGLTASTAGWAGLAAAAVVGATLSVLLTVLLFVDAFERADFDAQDLSGIWFVPETALLLGALVFSELAGPGPDSWNRSLTIVSLALLGAGGLLFGFTAAVFINRLIIHPQRRATGAPAMWIMISPLSVASLSLHFVADDGDYLASWGASVQSTADFMAALLWGFALWWIAAAGLTTWHGRREAMTHTPADWGFVFPPAALTLATLTLGRYWQSALMEAIGVALGVVLVTVWVLVAGAASTRVRKHGVAARTSQSGRPPRH